MSANVESMFYAGREKPWHGLGTQVEEAPTSADALRLAGLDWTVQRKPIQVCGGRKVDNFFANVRSSDGAVLGVVSDRYQVVQNAEAFAFTDALIGGEGQVHYETAGSLMGGRKIWLLAKLPDTEIVGDKTAEQKAETDVNAIEERILAAFHPTEAAPEEAAPEAAPAEENAAKAEEAKAEPLEPDDSPFVETASHAIRLDDLKFGRNYHGEE